MLLLEESTWLLLGGWRSVGVVVSSATTFAIVVSAGSFGRGRVSAGFFG